MPAVDTSHSVADALRHVLRRIRNDGNGPYRGLLTGDGTPVECVFTNRAAGLRYTCDVAGTTIAPGVRLERAVQLTSELGQPLQFPFPELQATHWDHQWGAWLGLRDESSALRLKVYAECPRQLNPTVARGLRAFLGRFSTLLDSHEYRLRIIAASDAAREFYFHARDMHPSQLIALARLAGIDGEPLLKLIEDAYGRPVSSRLPGHQQGFSFSFDGQARVSSLTFFGFARSVFGSDHATRAAVLGLAERRRWNMTDYETAFQMPRATSDRGSMHGMIAFTVSKGETVALSVGVRAPDALLCAA